VIAVIAAVGAPSSILPEVARDRRVTVCGFVREKATCRSCWARAHRGLI